MKMFCPCPVQLAVLAVECVLIAGGVWWLRANDSSVESLLLFLGIAPIIGGLVAGLLEHYGFPLSIDVGPM